MFSSKYCKIFKEEHLFWGTFWTCNMAVVITFQWGVRRAPKLLTLFCWVMILIYFGAFSHFDRKFGSTDIRNEYDLTKSLDNCSRTSCTNVLSLGIWKINKFSFFYIRIQDLDFWKFTEKYLCQSLFINKKTGLCLQLY